MARRFAYNRTWLQIASGWHPPLPVAAAPRKDPLARSTLAPASPDPWPARHLLPVARPSLSAVRWLASAARTSNVLRHERIPLAAHLPVRAGSLPLNAALARPHRLTAQPAPALRGPPTSAPASRDRQHPRRF